MTIITKEDFIQALKDIRAKGWVRCARPGNDGGVGNTLEDLLGIEENNLPIPNAAEWELKTQKANTTSLTTLLHNEPSPRAAHLVPNLLLPNYGWAHKDAGKKYPKNERSFRQTIGVRSATDRGFSLSVDRTTRKIMVSFDSNLVDSRHSSWLKEVSAKKGTGELETQPYWGFDDLFHAVGTKLVNCFYVIADVKRSDGSNWYHYNQIKMLKTFSLNGFLDAIEAGDVLVDFDARTGHNHGTKFRLRQGRLPDLYEEASDL